MFFKIGHLLFHAKLQIPSNCFLFMKNLIHEINVNTVVKLIMLVIKSPLK